MFNEYMWQRFYLTGRVDDFLICKESDEDFEPDESESARPMITF